MTNILVLQQLKSCEMDFHSVETKNVHLNLGAALTGLCHYHILNLLNL